MENKHLNARGKGEHTYDFTNDILLFKIRDREYQGSLEFENMVVDVDKEGFITGMRIFDASKVFAIRKEALRQIREFEFNARVEDKVITIQLKFVPIYRNKPMIKQGQNIVRQAQENIRDSEVMCTVA
ncbi:TPA: DUF2283 domain-containing protein [Candidatus Woesearchaeota archaeon]|nr:DUF2283 domain-containing protein [Candidatus Woesearchaeota archaeon]HIH04810.1 DUF2283 domain-containing protein [Candidatus Woesearchaeota archaeon]HIJ18395.1 DUF2283 domain-containing protein [Candidatus Woesearchaeota archaeon]